MKYLKSFINHRDLCFFILLLNYFLSLLSYGFMSSDNQILQGSERQREREGKIPTQKIADRHSANLIYALKNLIFFFTSFYFFYFFFNVKKEIPLRQMLRFA
jgi:hypothetical protein